MRGSTRLKVDLGLVCIREGAGGLGAHPLLNSEDVLQRHQPGEQPERDVR